MRGGILASRADKDPPADYLARVAQEALTRFPDADLRRQVIQDLYPLIKYHWRIGDTERQTARTLFSCDGRRIVASPIDETPIAPVRAPKGAKRGDVFGADEVRPAPPERRRAPRKPRAPRARVVCPPGTGGCALGLLGAVCGLPAALVLASPQGSPKPRDARYCLTSASRLIASHLPLKKFAPNPLYPPEVQERAYDRKPGEQLKVLSIAQNMIPELIFNGAVGALDGLPVATAGGIVLGGNGRTMALQVHYAQGGQAARDYLLDHAQTFGFSRANIEAVPDPVVVRVVETPDASAPNYRRDLQELVRLLNVPLMQSLDPRSESVAEARRLTDEVLDVLAVGLEGDQTLRDYLSSRQSRTLANALRRAGIITDRNAVRLIEGESFSEDGKTFVERLLLAALIPDAMLLESLDGQVRATLARATPWLLSAAAGGDDWDLRPALRAAVEDLIAMRRQGAPSVDAFLRQTVMGERPAVERVALGETMLRVLHDLGKKPLMFTKFARQFAESARQHPTAQGGLFAAEKLTPAEALRRAIEPESERV